MHKLCTVVLTGGACRLLCGDHWGQCVPYVIQQHAGVLYGCADSDSSSEIFCYTGEYNENARLRNSPDWSVNILCFQYYGQIWVTIKTKNNLANTFLFTRLIHFPTVEACETGPEIPYWLRNITEIRVACLIGCCCTRKLKTQQDIKILSWNQSYLPNFIFFASSFLWE